MKKRQLLLCRGKTCRKALAESDRVERTLARLPVEVARVGCQKVCCGPVVGLSIEGEWQWFGRMDSGKALRALARLVEEGKKEEIEKPLRKRHAAERSGKRR